MNFLQLVRQFKPTYRGCHRPLSQSGGDYGQVGVAHCNHSAFAALLFATVI